MFTEGSDPSVIGGRGSHIAEDFDCHSYGNDNDDRPKVVTLRDPSSGGGCLGVS